MRRGSLNVLLHTANRELTTGILNFVICIDFPENSDDLLIKNCGDIGEYAISGRNL